MNVLVIDAQGGGLGKQLVAAIKREIPTAYVTAVGTNNTAAMAMLKAGADEAATGENPVLVACRKADVIIGPVGIVIADSLLGEITEKMALAIARSDAKRILIPFNQCSNVIVGVPDFSLNTMVLKVIEEVKKTENRLDR